MTTAVERFAGERELRLPAELLALAQAFPSGADLGFVRLLGAEEMVAAAVERPLPAGLLVFAEGRAGEDFALHVPAEPGGAVSVVCAVERATGVYAPFAASVRGFAANLLVVGRAVAEGQLPAEVASGRALLARTFGLAPLLEARVEPHLPALAGILLSFEPGSPWACSLLARSSADPAAATARLSPALPAAPFAAGLLRQAGELFARAGEVRRAARALLTTLMRPEPNLQAEPDRLAAPILDRWLGARADASARSPEPVDPQAVFRFLAGQLAALEPQQRQATPLQFLRQLLAEGPAKPGRLAPDRAIDLARRRVYAGDLPGGRWILHLAFGAHFTDVPARRLLAAELSSAWRLAGSRWYATRFGALGR